MPHGRGGLPVCSPGSTPRWWSRAGCCPPPAARTWPPSSTRTSAEFLVRPYSVPQPPPHVNPKPPQTPHTSPSSPTLPLSFPPRAAGAPRAAPRPQCPHGHLQTLRFGTQRGGQNGVGGSAGWEPRAPFAPRDVGYGGETWGGRGEHDGDVECNGAMRAQWGEMGSVGCSVWWHGGGCADMGCLVSWGGGGRRHGIRGVLGVMVWWGQSGRGVCEMLCRGTVGSTGIWGPWGAQINGITGTR